MDERGDDRIQGASRESKSGSEPRRELRFAFARRNLLPALFREVLVALDLARGQAGGRLAELSELPDEEMAGIRPVISPAYEILVDDDQVWGRHRVGGKIVRLFSLEDKENLSAFNLFDGQTSLGQVGERLAEATGWDEERAFAHARDLFLTLVSHLVCVPRDPPADRESTSSAGRD